MGLLVMLTAGGIDCADTTHARHSDKPIRFKVDWRLRLRAKSNLFAGLFRNTKIRRLDITPLFAQIVQKPMPILALVNGLRTPTGYTPRGYQSTTPEPTTDAIESKSEALKSFARSRLTRRGHSGPP